jgi:hypothetical protein
MKWKDDPIGKDCINLNTTLARWLALRLQFLGDNTSGWPLVTDKEETQEEYDRQYRNWRIELWDTAKALKDYADADGNFDTEYEIRTERVQKAMQWVADNFTNLWN